MSSKERATSAQGNKNSQFKGYLGLKGYIGGPLKLRKQTVFLGAGRVSTKGLEMGKGWTGYKAGRAYVLEDMSLKERGLPSQAGAGLEPGTWFLPSLTQLPFPSPPLHSSP